MLGEHRSCTGPITTSELCGPYGLSRPPQAPVSSFPHRRGNYGSKGLHPFYGECKFSCPCSCLLLFLGDPGPTRALAEDAPRDCHQRRPQHRESGDDRAGTLCLWWPLHPTNPEATSIQTTPPALRRDRQPPQDVVRLARPDRWATLWVQRLCSLSGRLFRV